MELFVAILLLFGAFSLGSATHSDADDAPAGLELPVITSERQVLPGKDVAAKDVENVQRPECLADRHFVIYRDLTAPYKNEIRRETTPASDEETSPDE